MSNFITTYIQKRVDAIILAQIEKLHVAERVEEAIETTISDFNIDRDIERAIEDVVNNLEAEDHLEAAINELKLDSIVEDKIDMMIGEALSDVKEKANEMLLQGYVEHLVNYIIEHQLRINVIGQRFKIKIEGDKEVSSKP